MNGIYNLSPLQLQAYIDSPPVMESAVVSNPLLAAFHNGIFLGVVGFIPLTLLSDTAYIWSYNPEGIPKYPFARAARRIIQVVHQIYPKLIGDCLSQSSRSFVGWLGGEFISPQRFEISRRQ